MNETLTQLRVDAKRAFETAVKRGDVEAEKVAWAVLTALDLGAREVALGLKGANKTND